MSPPSLLRAAFLAFPLALLIACGADGDSSGNPPPTVLRSAVSAARATLPMAFPGRRDEFSITIENGRTIVSRTNTTAPPVNLDNPVLIRFYDRHVAFGEDSSAAEVYRLYRAAFKRTPDEAGLGYWIAAAAQGMAIGDIALHFGSSQEFENLYGRNPTADAMVELLYKNVLGRAPDAAGKAYWLAAVKNGLSLSQMLVYFAASAENKSAVRAAIQGGINYLPRDEEQPAGIEFGYEWYLSMNRPYAWDRVGRDVHPVRYGLQSERFEIRPGDCFGTDCTRSDSTLR